MSTTPTPFELDFIADSYDMAYWKERGQLQWLQEGKFRYPAVFGSTGGRNYLDQLRRLDSICPDVTNLLELGCGAGAFLEVLRANGFQQPYTGLDYSRTHIERARRYYPDATFVAGDAARLPFPDRAFDFVFENNLFPFLLQPEMAIREMARVSRRYVYFKCHATPIAGGVYCYQPIFAPLRVERGTDGTERQVLPENLGAALRPKHLMPQLTETTSPGHAKVAVAKVRKHYLNIDRLQTVIRALGAEVLDQSLQAGRYPAIMNERLTGNNSYETITATADDYATTEQDVLLQIDGMDVTCFLRVGNDAGRPTPA